MTDPVFSSLLCDGFSLLWEVTDCLVDGLLQLLLLQMLRHINFAEVNRVPDFSGREHGVNGGQNHPGNGDDGPLLSPALRQALILQGVGLKDIICFFS